MASFPFDFKPFQKRHRPYGYPILLEMVAPTSRLIPLNPFTLKPAGEYSLLDSAALRDLVSRAQGAARAWGRVPVAERIRAVREALQYFDLHRAIIAQDITAQMGKPLRQSENEVNGFFERANHLLSIAEATLAPETLPEKPGFHRRIEHVPLGVVLIIAPWNYPLLTSINGVATALLSGNAVLLKHSSLTPEIGAHFARAFAKLGPLVDVLQAFQARHEDIEKAIGENGIDHVVFTGSVEGGRLMQRAAASRFIDCNLELGGKDAAYVAADADLAKAAADLVDGAMYNAGQSCCGIERVYVHRSRHDEFIDRCKSLVADYVLGDPMEAKTNMGPLASAKAAKVMQAQVDAAKAGGAQVLAGGRSVVISQGTFFEPTLMLGATQAMEIVREENFGPLLPILSVTDDAEAIERVNDSPYGLTSAIYSQDVERANRFAAEADTGTVFLNRCDYLDPALPWTGVRDSGRGTTLSKYGFYGLTRRKAIHFRLPG